MRCSSGHAVDNAFLSSRFRCLASIIGGRGEVRQQREFLKKHKIKMKKSYFSFIPT